MIAASLMQAMAPTSLAAIRSGPSITKLVDLGEDMPALVTTPLQIVACRTTNPLWPAPHRFSLSETAR